MFSVFGCQLGEIKLCEKLNTPVLKKVRTAHFRTVVPVLVNISVWHCALPTQSKCIGLRVEHTIALG